jgi:Astacin (Peptidase family M12A)
MGLSRRDLVCGCIVCSVGLPLHGTAWAQDEDEDSAVVCGTDETVVQGGFTIDDFAVDGDKLIIQSALKDFKITDYGTAMLSKRWRRRDGLTPNKDVITLGCFLMSGTATQQETVRQSAQGWLSGGVEKLINFDFTVPQERSQIRIMIGGPGNNSSIGRDALNVAISKQTMNLTNITRGTIQHEFGHALGLLHEHMHPGFDAPLLADVVIAEMAKPPNSWDEAKTRRNILNRLGTKMQCLGDPNFNPDSVMMYNIPKRWTADGVGFARAGQIHDRDIACVRGLYIGGG